MHAFFRSLSFLFGLALPLVLFAQPDTSWTVRIYDTSGPTVVNPVLLGAANLSNGDFAVVGAVTMSDAMTNAFIGRISADGQLLWFRLLGSANLHDSAKTVVETAYNNLIVVGHSGGVTPATIRLWALTGQGDSLWSRAITGVGETRAGDAAMLADGNMLVYGYRRGVYEQRSDAWLLKFSPVGDTLWTRLLGGTDTDVGNCIIVGSENRYYLSGSSQSVGYGDYDFWIVLADSTGTLTIQDAAGTTVIERCYGMCLTDSAVYLVGRTSPTTTSLSDGYVAKATLNGVFTWYLPFVAGLSEEQFMGAVGLPDGGVRCAGWAGTSALNVKPWIADIGSDGLLHNSWTYDGFQAGQLRGIILAGGGGYLTWGTMTEGGLSKGLVMRLGAGGGIGGVVTETDHGEPLPGIRIGVTGSQRHTFTNGLGQYYIDLIAGIYNITVSGPCVDPDTAGDITVIEDSTTTLNLTAGVPDYDAPQTSVNLVVQNHIPSGEPFVICNFGSGAMNFSITSDPLVPNENWLSTNPSQGMVPAHDSVTVQVIVSASAPEGGIYDYYGYIDIHAKSCPDSFHHIPVLATVLDVGDRRDGLPTDFALFAPYPNPFNATTRLAFSLPHTANVRLAVYDISGRMVRTLIEGQRNAGRHEVVLDAGDRPSGVYLVRLDSGSFSGTRKLLLLK